MPGMDVAIHCPPHGCPSVDTMVGVQVDDGRHGASLPMVQLVTGMGVCVGRHRPPQNTVELGSQSIVGVQIAVDGQG